MNKLQTAQLTALKTAIEINSVAVERVLLFVAGKQTIDERAFGVTHYDNGVGFSGFDANFGTSLADGIVRQRAKGVTEGLRLSAKQLPYARKMAKKYAGQVIKLGVNLFEGEGENV